VLYHLLWTRVLVTDVTAGLLGRIEHIDDRTSGNKLVVTGVAIVSFPKPRIS
jgi:hypothetical protein